MRFSELHKEAYKACRVPLNPCFLQEGKAIAADDKPIPLAGDETIESIQRADTAGQMWAAIGQDSYSIVPIQSTLHPEATLEGTRLTVVSPLIFSLDH